MLLFIQREKVPIRIRPRKHVYCTINNPASFDWNAEAITINVIHHFPNDPANSDKTRLPTITRPAICPPYLPLCRLHHAFPSCLDCPSNPAIISFISAMISFLSAPFEM